MYSLCRERSVAGMEIIQREPTPEELVELWDSKRPRYAWLARVDSVGNVLWETRLDHGFQWEDIATVIDNGDGTWAVLSQGGL